MGLKARSDCVLPFRDLEITPVLQKLIAVFVAETDSVTCLTAVVEHGIEIVIEVTCRVGDVASESLDLDSLFRRDQLTWLMY